MHKKEDSHAPVSISDAILPSGVGPSRSAPPTRGLLLHFDLGRSCHAAKTPFTCLADRLLSGDQLRER